MYLYIRIAATVLPAIIGLVLFIKNRNTPAQERPSGPGQERPSGPGPAFIDLEQRLYDMIMRVVEPRLRELEEMRPGSNRTTAIKKLMKCYHWDKHRHLPGMESVITRVSATINDRTDRLLKEDRAPDGR